MTTWLPEVRHDWGVAMALLLLGLVWLVGSVPLAVVVGRLLRGPSREAGRPAAFDRFAPVL